MADQTRYQGDNPFLTLFHQKGIPLTIKSKRFLVNVGDVCDKLFLVLEGGFVCQHYNPKSDRLRTINFHLKEFHPVGTVLDSFFRNSTSECQLKAVKKSNVLMIRKGIVLSEVNDKPEFKDYFMSELTYALTMINELHTKLLTLDSKDMYQYMLKDWGPVIKEVPALYIAEFMGVTPEWLSRLKQLTP